MSPPRELVNPIDPLLSMGITVNASDLGPPPLGARVMAPVTCVRRLANAVCLVDVIRHRAPISARDARSIASRPPRPRTDHQGCEDEGDGEAHGRGPIEFAGSGERKKLPCSTLTSNRDRDPDETRRRDRGAGRSPPRR